MIQINENSSQQSADIKISTVTPAQTNHQSVIYFLCILKLYFTSTEVRTEILSIMLKSAILLPSMNEKCLFL